MFFLAVWKRPEITELCFMGLKRLMGHCGGSALAVISEKSMIPLCKRYGIDYCEHENQPLGAKKNFGLNEAMKRDFDYLVELGSDNLILCGMMDKYKPLMQSGEDYFGGTKLYFVDATNGHTRSYEAFESQYGYGFGLGRCMSYRLLESVGAKVKMEMHETCINGEDIFVAGTIGWANEKVAKNFEASGLATIKDSKLTYKLWSDDSQRMLDNDSNARIMAHGFKYRAVETPEPMMADIKSDENIWSFNSTIGEPADIEKFINSISKQEKAMFFENQKKLKAKRIEKAA